MKKRGLENPDGPAKKQITPVSHTAFKNSSVVLLLVILWYLNISSSAYKIKHENVKKQTRVRNEVLSSIIRTDDRFIVINTYYSVT